MVVKELDGLVHCCDDEAECKTIFVDLDFCGDEMRGRGFWLHFASALISEGGDKTVCVLAVLLVEFHPVWVRTIGRMEESRGNFSIGAALAGRE